MKLAVRIFLSATLTMVAALCSCTDSGGLFGDRERDTIRKYYSAEEPGRWETQAVDHDVKVSIIEDAKGKKGIEVSVPFTSGMNEQHYVEAIALLDGKEKQISAVKFKRGEKAVTIFPVTDKIKFPVYIVAKCNMHDMWRKKVTGKEKAGVEGE